MGAVWEPGRFAIPGFGHTVMVSLVEDGSVSRGSQVGIQDMDKDLVGLWGLGTRGGSRGAFSGSPADGLD